MTIVPLARIAATFVRKSSNAPSAWSGLPAAWSPYATLTADIDGLIRWAETNSNPGNGRFFRVERP